MNKRNQYFFVLIAACFLMPSVAHAYWVWSPESGKFINPEKAVQDSAEEQFDYAMQYYKEQNLDEAAKQFENLLKKYPGASVSAEAQYRLGSIYEEKQDYLKAFEAYKVLVESYPQSERFPEVIEREFQIGNLFFSGRKAKLMGLEILPALPRAVEVFKHILTSAPYSDFGPKAQFYLGLTYKKMGHFDEAVEAFQGVLDQYPQSEFVSQARFQITESSFLKSTAQFRDQRALDEASMEVDRLLAHGSDAPAMEKAEKIKQVIDEKNAEKNYRVGMYYEKDKYLQSALIYYQDVAKRYPHTDWGRKAADRIRALEAPASFMSEHQKEINDQIQLLQSQLEALPDDAKEEKKRLENELKRLEGQTKTLEHNKEDILQSRQEDIQRRKSELKEKFKKLEKKKKMMGENPSEDFQKAMDRWYASLTEEQDALEKEEAQLREWREELGVGGGQDWLDYIPFLGASPTELEKVRQIEAKKLYKLSQEKKDLLEQKEVLYRDFAAYEATSEFAEGERPAAVTSSSPERSIDEAGLKDKANATQSEILELQSLMDQKREDYESRFGKSAWMAVIDVPANLVTASGQAVVKSVSFLNPFDAEEDLSQMDLSALLEVRMHVKEKIHAQQEIVQTLSRAFNSELAIQEQGRLIQAMQKEPQPDPMVLRKKIKSIEKEIRSHSEDIQDGHARKNDLLNELEKTLEQKAESGSLVERAGNKVLSPIRGTAAFLKGFVVGMPERDEKLTQSAGKNLSGTESSQKAVELKNQIEKESLMVEARYAEISRLEKEREILKAQASLSGGYKFRSAFVDVPYRFLEEAVRSAQRIVPKKERDEVLVDQLEKESRELEKLKKQLKDLDREIDQRDTLATDGRAEGAEQAVSESQAPVSEERLKEEIEQLAKQLRLKKELHARQLEIYQNALKSSGLAAASENLDERSLAADQVDVKELNKKTEKTKKMLFQVIQDELRLENEELGILQKRIAFIEKILPEITSKMRMQDLNTEKDRLQERSNQIDRRVDFLTKELDRFQKS